jgi:positive regulator of sigma E activity
MVVRKNSQDIKVNVTAMSIHVGAYLMYLIGLVYFFVDSFASAELTADKWLVTQTVRTTFMMISQIMLCYVFYQIYKFSS